MPIPFLFIGAAAATAAFGVGSTIKAGVDQNDANSTNERANSMVERASKKIDWYRKNKQTRLISSPIYGHIRVLSLQ